MQKKNPSYNKRSRWKKVLKVFLITKGVLFLIVIFFSFYLSKVHHTTAHKEFVEFINQEFEGKVTFKDFDYSYLKSFPKVYVGVDSITVRDSNSGESTIGKLEILFNLKSLWNDKYEIEKFMVKDAFLYHEVDSLGNKPRFFDNKKKRSVKGKTPLSIESHDVEIKNSQFYFGNLVKGNRTYISVQDGLLNLDVTDSLIVVYGNISANLDTLIGNHNILFRNQPAAVKNAVFKIDRATGVKELLDGTIVAHTLELTPRLKLVPQDDGQLIDFHILSDGNFDTFLELFEFHSGFDLKQVNPQAKLSMSYNQQGFVNVFKRPYFELDFVIADAEFSGSQLQYPVKNFSTKGNYNNGKEHSPESAELVIDTLHAEISDSYVNGRFKLNDLKDPIIDAHLISEIDLSHLLKENANFYISGQLDIDLILDGKISEFKKLHIEGKQVAKGAINFRNLNLVLKDKGDSINLKNGSAILNNHIFEVTRLIGAFNESAFHFNGVFDNLGQFIINEKEELTGKLNLNFEQLNLNEFNFDDLSENAGTTSKSKTNVPMVDLDLNITGKEIIGDIGVLNNFSLKGELNPDNISVNSFSFNYQEGEIKGKGDIFFKQGKIDAINAIIKGNFEQYDLSEFTKKDNVNKKQNVESIFSDLPPKLDVQVVVLANQISYKDQYLSDFKANLDINDNQILINKLSTSLPYGTMDISFQINEMRNEKINYRGAIDLKLDTVNLNRLLKSEALGLPNKNTGGGKASAGSKESVPSFTFPSNFNVTLTSKANRIYYENGQVDDLNLYVVYNSEMIALKKLDFDFAGGHVSTNGYMLNDVSKSFPVYVASQTDSLDIQYMLGAFNNFNQDVFNADNSSGTLSWNSNLYFDLKTPLFPIINKNLWKFDISVHDAEFRNIEPIENALFFIGHKAKDNLMVKELDIKAYFFEDKILFKDVLMNDNIANLDLFGEIDLADSLIDIGVVVSLSDLFFRSKKKRIIDTREGRIHLGKDLKVFLKMEGPLSEHKIRKSSKKKFIMARENLSTTIKKAENELRQKGQKKL